MPALNLDDEGCIYFATFDHATVKVGFATEVRKRLLQMQVSSPVDVEEIASYPGTPADERRVHILLKKHHIKREWFEWSDEVEELLNNLSDARTLIQFERGQDYEPTLKECLDYENAGEKMDDFLSCLSKGLQMIRGATP